MRYLPALFLTALLLSPFAGCERISSVFGRALIPDMGPRLPKTAHIEFDPSLTTAIARYADACNHPQELRIGEELESVLLDAAHQTFEAVHMPDQVVQTPGAGTGRSGADVDITISLEQSGLNIQTDNIYDRLPAELTLNALAVFKDRSGKVLAERSLKTTRRDKIILEPTQHRCAYVTMDSFLHGAAVTLSTQFAREARDLLDPDGRLTAGPQAPAPTAPQATLGATSPPMPMPTISFKATILDESGNLILESGERVTVRVEVANTGPGQANGVSATVSGPPIIVSHFPAPTLPVGSLQPGESRSLEFTGTVPSVIQAQRVDLVVTVTEASGSAAPPAQTVAAMMRPSGDVQERPPLSGTSVINVDRVPDAVPGFERPRTYLISIGISVHRDRQTPTRKYAAMDAELVADYFRAVGGVPAPNVRLLQDWKALRPDIEEVILDWLPAHATSESAVIVYFAGQAKVALSGDTFLVPYEGGQSTTRLYPVKDLFAALGRLKARQIVLIFDGSVSKLEEGQAKAKAPQWGQREGNIIRLIGTTGFQSSLEPEKLHHSLFTYYLLRGLRGEADGNRDREVTLGELAAFLRKAVPDAARQGFSHDQRPLIIPSIQAGSHFATMPLTMSPRLAVSNGS